MQLMGGGGVMMANPRSDCFRALDTEPWVTYGLPRRFVRHLVDAAKSAALLESATIGYDIHSACCTRTIYGTTDACYGTAAVSGEKKSECRRSLTEELHPISHLPSKACLIVGSPCVCFTCCALNIQAIGWWVAYQ